MHLFALFQALGWSHMIQSRLLSMHSSGTLDSGGGSGLMGHTALRNTPLGQELPRQLSLSPSVCLSVCLAPSS